MRLNACLKRWDDAMDHLEGMEAQWSDAYTTLISFIELEASKKRAAGDKASLALYNKCMCLLIHCFSLLNALAMTSLVHSSGELYGRTSKEGRENIFQIEYVPFVQRADGSGLVDFNQTLNNMKDLDKENEYGIKDGWPKRVLVKEANE